MLKILLRKELVITLNTYNDKGTKAIYIGVLESSAEENSKKVAR
jgi:hypothetical protein